MRQSIRETSEGLSKAGGARQKEAEAQLLEGFKARLAPGMLTEKGEVRLPMSKAGLHMALLNAERYAGRNVERQLKAGKIEVGGPGGRGAGGT